MNGVPVLFIPGNAGSYRQGINYYVDIITKRNILLADLV